MNFKNRKYIISALFVSVFVNSMCAVQNMVDVASNMTVAKRIVIIGSAGSGKSVLGQKLHEIVRLPIYHLDQYFWKENWTRPNRDEYKVIHDSLCDKSEWIIEGMSLWLLEYRIQKADVIIFLNLPTYVCLWRVLRRTMQNYGTVGSTSAQGCVESINWRYVEFLKGLWNFKMYDLSCIMELLHTYSEEKNIYILKSPHEVDTFISQLQANHNEQVSVFL